MKRLKDLLLENTPSRITEQSVDLSSLELALSQQEDIFKSLQQALRTVNYMDISEEAKSVLKNNAEILATSYLEYIEKTRVTMLEFGNTDATEYDIVNENTSALAANLADIEH